MRKILLVGLLLLPGMAWAADMPLKAPPVQGYPNPCGFYYGLNAMGSGATVPNAVAGTTMIGGDVGLVVGYACVMSSIPYFIEGIADFQNLNANAPGFSLQGPTHLEQRVAIQTPLRQFFPALGLNTGTPPNLPVLPPGVTVTGGAQNYVYGAINEDDISAKLVPPIAANRAWLVQGEVGTGLLYPVKLPNGWNSVIDVWAGLKLQSDQLCLGAKVCPTLGTGFVTGFAVKL